MADPDIMQFGFRGLGIDPDGHVDANKTGGLIHFDKLGIAVSIDSVVPDHRPAVPLLQGLQKTVGDLAVLRGSKSLYPTRHPSARFAT